MLIIKFLKICPSYRQKRTMLSKRDRWLHNNFITFYISSICKSHTHTSLPNLCAKEFGAVLDGSPMTNVDKGIESCRQTNNSDEYLCKDKLFNLKLHPYYYFLKICLSAKLFQKLFKLNAHFDHFSEGLLIEESCVVSGLWFIPLFGPKLITCPFISNK